MSDAAALMDRMYRRQRHIYDLSRKFYLLGRDEAIARLRPAPGDKVLEIACGTGRNLVKLARAYPRGSAVRPRRLAGNAGDRGRLDRARRARLAHRLGTGGRHGVRPAGAVRLRQFRARHDLVRPVDDPALASGARPRARRSRARRIAAHRRFRRLRRLAGPVQGGIAPLARRLRRDPARRSQRRARRAVRRARHDMRD